jgi:hypothetical protein
MLCTVSVFSGHALAVVVPAGSVDGLSAAIAEAGPGGEVVLAAGLHKISGTVMIDIPVCGSQCRCQRGHCDRERLGCADRR